MNIEQSSIQPYLFFGGRCQEALDFYQAAVGATVELLMLFSESPQPVPEGMLKDRFGVHWMVMVPGAQP